MAPGRPLSMRMWHRISSSLKRSGAPGLSRSRVTLFLLVLRCRKRALFSRWGTPSGKGPWLRLGSPTDGCSTFMTSAP